MVRFKNRYLLAEAYPIKEKTGLEDYSPGTCPQLNSTTLAAQLRSIIEREFGQQGAALASQSFSIKYCNASTGMILVRAARGMLSEIWAALTLLTEPPSGEEGNWIWRVVHVSGTIRSAQKFAMKHVVSSIELLLKFTNKEEERKRLREMILKSRAAIKAVSA